jgi:Flp pilus assembly secretin CpaC
MIGRHHIAGFIAFLIASPALAGEIEVPIDNSRAVQLARPAATILVGNPSIADVTVVDGTHLFVLGRSFGGTNIIALDGGGETIARMDVVVIKDGSRAVTLFRGAGRTTYSCTENCQKTLTIGDEPEVYAAVNDQSSTKMGLAANTAAPEGKGR